MTDVPPGAGSAPQHFPIRALQELICCPHFLTSGQVTMRRREFIALLGGAAASWPIAAHGQQRERMRRIGMLMNLTPGDPEAQNRIAGFLQGLQELKWTVGRNVRVDYRWGSGADSYRRGAEELIALTPDLIVASTTPALVAADQVTRTLPIVFVNVTDPIALGLIESLSHPGSNATGFTLFEHGMVSKLLELLKEISPQVTQVAVLRDPSSASAMGQLGAIQAVAPSLRVELHPTDGRNPDEMERAAAALAGGSNGGLIVLASSLGGHRDFIISLATRYRLPAVYPFPYYVNSGGLICYGPDSVDQYRRAASYVDRIFKGEMPADLPVQSPTKYALAINLKSAKAIGLSIPPALLARADELIE
jgi:putative tryptophan/tyrosine transport system substrate-binding protein